MSCVFLMAIRDRATGEDLYPEVREKFLANYPHWEPLKRDMLRLTGYLLAQGDTHISEYLSYTHNPGTRAWERYQIHLYDWEPAAHGRNAMWQRIERMVAGDGTELEELRYAHSEGLYEVIHGIAHDVDLYRVSINVPNHGAIANLPDHTIVETPAIISGMGVLPLRMGDLPPVPAELCRREAERVELIVDASVHGDRELALQALALDPMVDDLDMARAILDDYLTVHKETLPQFYGNWRW